MAKKKYRRLVRTKIPVITANQPSAFLTGRNGISGFRLGPHLSAYRVN